jgi:hypothetical protein
MIRTFIKAAFLLLAITGFSTVHGHHGWGDYDASKTLTLTGTIVESKYENPHATLKLKTADKTWFAWLAPVSRMEARGMNGDMVKVGATVTLIGYPSTSKKDELRVERIIVNGKPTELR